MEHTPSPQHEFTVPNKQLEELLHFGGVGGGVQASSMQESDHGVEHRPRQHLFAVPKDWHDESSVQTRLLTQAPWSLSSPGTHEVHEGAHCPNGCSEEVPAVAQQNSPALHADVP